MPICRRLALLAVAMGGIVSGADAWADQAANLRRLGAMPLEQRRALAQNLVRFDAMGSADREAIRAVDRELAGQPELDRARYLAVLRRYHLWLQRLPKEKHDAINAAPPQERMALVTKFRAEELVSDVRRRTPLFLQVVDLGDMSPFDVAQWLKIWFMLTPSEREKYNRGPRLPGPWRLRFLDSLDPSRKIDPPEGQFTKEEEESLVREMMKKPEFRYGLPDDIISMLFSGMNPEASGDAEARKIEGRPDFRDRPPPSGRNGGGRIAFLNRRRADIVHCLAGNYHFIVNSPVKVEPRYLFRFLSTLPKGISESFTYLPPEEARRRLTILYRLIYPFPGEMDPSGNTSNPPGAPSTESTGKVEPRSPQPTPGLSGTRLF